MNLNLGIRTPPRRRARVLRAKAELRAALDAGAPRGRTIGLVPTMGYLHDGHLSLLRAARAECDVVVMSLFVNPTQFGPGEDLDRYPRDEERDLRLAAEAGVDLVYAPAVEEVYPDGFATAVEVGGSLTEVLDGDPGRRGPEHFRGVTTVVAKLFNTRRPRRRLLRPEGRPAGGRHPAHGPRPRLPGADRGAADRARARRPGDELAQRLPRRGDRERAAALSRALRAAERGARDESLPAGLDAARRELARRRDRARVPRGPRRRDAEPVTELNGRPVLVAVAARVGGARLIDNVLIRP